MGEKLQKDKDIIYPEQIKDDMVDHTKKLVMENPKIRALKYEYANLPAHPKAVQSAVSLPVFDLITLADRIYSALVRKEFIGFR